MCLCAPTIALYPSSTTSSQSAPDRNRGGTQRSQQLWAFLFCSSLSTAFFSQHMCFVCWKIMTWLWWYLLKQIERLDTIYARCNTSSWLLCDQSTYSIGSFSAVPGGQRETVARFPFGSFTMVWSQIREGNWTSILSRFTCQWHHSSCWCQSCCSILVAIMPWSKLWQKFL